MITNSKTPAEIEVSNTTVISKEVHHGGESLSFLALKIWELVPDSIREKKTLSFFKNKINLFVPNAPFLSRLVFWCFQGVEKGKQMG